MMNVTKELFKVLLVIFAGLAPLKPVQSKAEPAAGHMGQFSASALRHPRENLSKCPPARLEMRESLENFIRQS